MGEPGAVRHARRGVMLAEQSGDASLIGLAHAQLGVVLVERALHDDARAALTFALRAAEQLGEPTNECRVLVYSSMLELDRGRPLQASFWLAKAQRISARIDHRVARGMVAGSLGVAHLYRGYTRAAREALIEADLLLEDVGNRHARTTFLAFLAAAEALMGHPNEARAALAQARELVGQGDETHYAAHIVDLLACVPELVQGGNLDVARARLAAVEQGDPSPASGWADLRVAAAIVRRIALGDRPRLPVTEARPGLVVAHDAMWFRLESSHAVDLSRRAVLRRLLDRLVRERLEAPGSPLPRSELIAAAWPDAKNVRSRTFSNRLHVALSTLRSLGLRSVLVSSAEGHRLREDVELTRELPAP